MVDAYPLAESMKAAVLFLGLWLIVGCASQQSYVQLPEEYTKLAAGPGESYLIYAVQAFGEPGARRFDFNEQGGVVRVAIHRIYKNGPRPVVHRSGEEALQLRTIFREFDWNAVEPKEEVTALYPDDLMIIFKARTAHAYREAHGGMAECKALDALFRAVMKDSE